MQLVVLNAYFLLVVFDLYLARRNFAALYRKVRNFPLIRKTQAPGGIETVCSAVDRACIWYPKPVLCLQRSAVTACLMKGRGIPATLVIGVQQLPFKAHAWVEVEGLVVNDRPYTPEIYTPLDRC
jgi:hypothetical protein